jgi:hypothetical protein
MPNKKPEKQRKAFTAVLEPDGTALRWVIARVPFDIAKAWPVRKGRRVRGEIEGFAFRTTLFPDPRPVRAAAGHLLLVNKKMQKGAGARMGDKVRIWLEPDLEEREVSLPAELERELNADRRLRRLFDGMSEARRREFGKFADQPKSPASRQKRAGKIAEMLMQAIEGMEDPPPVLKALFQRQPSTYKSWMALTPTQKRNHLLGIFYYSTPEARERRAQKAIEAGSKKAGNRE